jgi:2-phospho-L-lactate guanylyltransferase
MSILLIPIAPLSRTKTRLRDCFPKDLLKDLTIAMFKDLAGKVRDINCFDQKIVYCHDNEILELADGYDLIGIKEKLTKPRKSFDEVIFDLNNIAIEKFNANNTIFTFLDVILISITNFKDISKLLETNQLVVCPAIHSAGISIFGRNPPDVIPTYFSDPSVPSFVKLIKEAQERNLKYYIYDSFRAGFDIDIKQDLLLGFEYLKLFNQDDTETFKFLKNNLKLALQKRNLKNNRQFKISKTK